MTPETLRKLGDQLIMNPALHSYRNRGYDAPDLTEAVKSYCQVYRAISPEGEAVEVETLKLLFPTIDFSDGSRHPTNDFATFFRDLIQLVGTTGNPGVNDPPLHKLSEWDLFHGHLRYNTATGKFIIVFHAKEYPREIKVGSPFSWNDAVFRYRNALWTEQSNQVFFLDASNWLVNKLIEGYAGHVGIPLAHARPAKMLAQEVLGERVVQANFLYGVDGWPIHRQVVVGADTKAL